MTRHASFFHRSAACIFPPALLGVGAPETSEPGKAPLSVSTGNIRSRQSFLKLEHKEDLQMLCVSMSHIGPTNEAI
jgi:hypothetical protein